MAKVVNMDNYLNEIKYMEERGYSTIAGVDEVGRGPLAGPVVVASVIMPHDHFIEGIKDSKKISEKKREMLYEIIIENAIEYKIEFIDREVIDRINILNATKQGMVQAIEGLETIVDRTLVDGNDIHLKTDKPIDYIIKGDAKSYSIGAASIIAKVARDSLMREYDSMYPSYEFAKNKGYGTAVHIAALKENGPCPIHRRSFITHFVEVDKL